MIPPTTENIFLFVPNIIGYGRIVLALIAFWFMRSNFIISGLCYAISALLDSIDGHAARMLNQSTRFGAMLDQLTDRCGTMGLLVALSHFYPEYMFLFQVSMAIDISCHWIYMQTSVVTGKSSHKTSDNVLMQLYYQKDILTFMCCANELFYISLYVLNFSVGPQVMGYSFLKICAYGTAPFAFLKTIISCAHAYIASIYLAEVDIKDRTEKLGHRYLSKEK